MRGAKRKAAAIPAAIPAVQDAILDMANRKGMRCCVECGATSTPQWREGPMGPKTLCNACGVRRQRLLRKQQAAAVGVVQTAPVAAVQARRRLGSRATEQMHLSGDFSFGVGPAGSDSDHSSDNTELGWTPGSAHHHHHRHSQLQPNPSDLPTLLPTRDCDPAYASTMGPESGGESLKGNEEACAAYDLLFFAGVGVGGGHDAPPPPAALRGRSLLCRSRGLAYDEEGADEEEEPYGSGAGAARHGHNTRRQVLPLRRSDEFLYYDQELELVVGDGGGGGAGKRRRAAAAASARPVARVAAPGGGSSLSSSEGFTQATCTLFGALLLLPLFDGASSSAASYDCAITSASYMVLTASPVSAADTRALFAAYRDAVQRANAVAVLQLSACATDFAALSTNCSAIAPVPPSSSPVNLSASAGPGTIVRQKSVKT
ncbi:GATA transcription factor 8 [Tetrabaena socialis]|uniref:GATA transcription factor 8 n=1 Tax=Tetrabaena socialis TaxID=47790 RepID=A0A2J8A2V5_9CHLO|nr:GATA transcription factor 8 [Tetrabaena socialis]|eukprot:PNH06851.1 GATA transcription factor 8 [Tetrabaena socialis]